MTSLIEKVADALREAVGDDAIIYLDGVLPNGLSGMVLSSSFAGESPAERQARIWRSLDMRLSQVERTRIAFIMTDTPDRYDVLKAALDSVVAAEEEGYLSREDRHKVGP